MSGGVRSNVTKLHEQRDAADFGIRYSDTEELLLYDGGACLVAGMIVVGK